MKNYIRTNKGKPQFVKKEIIFIGLECRGSKEIYDGINENVQKMDRIVGFLMIKLSLPCVMFSKLFSSYFAYFTTDVGNEAFELSFPYWQVLTISSLMIE